GDARAGVGVERVPALGFAARLAILARHGVVRMHLHGELVLGKKQLDEQWKLAVSKMAAKQLVAVLGGDVLKRLPGERAGGGGAHFSGEPDFADGLAFGLVVVPGGEVVKAPDAGAEPGFESEGEERTHATP